MQNTNYKRTTLTKCLLIFCREKAKPIQFFGKIDSEKNIKNFIVNNNNNKICAWYLSSKWPVCRSIVNQTSGGTSRTKLSTLKQISSNIAPCFTITWLKYSCNKWILSIQIMGNAFLSFFETFPLLTGEQNQWFIFYYYFVSPNGCVMPLTVLKLVVHI